MNRREIHTVIITGSTGAIGVALCQAALQAGCSVYAVVRPNSPRIGQLPESDHLHLVGCDLSELWRLPELLPEGNYDALFHLGWAHTIGAGRNDMTAQVKNIQYTLDAVRCASSLGCKVFIGAGSQAEYGRVEGDLEPDTPCFPENGYGMAKLCAGQMSRVECHKAGMDHIWCRILSVYGPYDGLSTMISSTIRKLLQGEKPALTAGEQKWDYLYSEDAAQALYHLALCGKNGAVYPLGSGVAIPLRDYIIVLKDSIDPQLPLGFGEVPYGEKQVMYLKADISPLQEDTGWNPKISFEEGIRKTIEWVKATTEKEVRRNE